MRRVFVILIELSNSEMGTGGQFSTCNTFSTRFPFNQLTAVALSILYLKEVRLQSKAKSIVEGDGVVLLSHLWRNCAR